MAEEEVKEEAKEEAAAAPEKDAAPAAGGKAPLVPRIIAAIIDGIIGTIAAVIVGIVLGIVGGFISVTIAGVLAGVGGGLVSAAWMGIRDSVMQGRSPGKKFLGLTIVGPGGKPVTREISIKRNMPFIVTGLGSAVGALLGLVMGLLNTIVSLACLAIVVYELYLVVTDKNGLRWGDKSAGTQVVKAA